MYTIAGTLLSDCFRSFWDDSIHATFLVIRNCLVEFFKLVETYFPVCGRTWLAYVWYLAGIVETHNQSTQSRLWTMTKIVFESSHFAKFQYNFFFKILYINYSLFKLIYFMIYYNLGLGLLYVRSIISKHVIHF